LSRDPAFGAIEETYRSNIVSGRSPIAIGFDRRAYNEGARIMEAVAQQLGGRTEMIAFLSYVYRNYTFAPFTTFDFLDYLQDYAGVDMTTHFLNWLYMDEENNSIAGEISTLAGRSVHEMKVDMTPPRRLLEKYKIKEAHR
ncbi:MAG: M1 family metallopeptidase, partial [bacterium]|nr:M1 family metallopeptidase [bacterium]